MMDVLNDMRFYSLHFLQAFAVWLVENPVAFIFVTLGILSFVFYVFRRWFA